MPESFFADLHIHIGRTASGRPVKISGSRDLTFYNIAREASGRKGLDIVGIIDCHSPAVQEEIRGYLQSGEMEELSGGGVRYGNTTVLLGTEMELKEPGHGPFHVLAYFPTLELIAGFAEWMRGRMKNVHLSSQRIYVSARELQHEVARRDGLFIPAHIFTPHKSVYGSAADRMAEVLDLSLVDAVELGLSADTEMAGHLSELDPFPFLTNSDAHSLPKIAREYNCLRMEAPTFSECVKALRGSQGRRIEANYGLNPRLGKYHRTFCISCGQLVPEESAVRSCPHCGSGKTVRGVYDRIRQIADRTLSQVPDTRPPYHVQVPLEFIPGVGKKTLERLLERFGTEMHLLHSASPEAIAREAGKEVSEFIRRARDGTLELAEGGGGRYGKIKS